MPTQITAMLAVSDPPAAIQFYVDAFGAELLWKLGEAQDIVAGLSIGEAKFFLALDAPSFGTRAPDKAGFTTVRIELFVDDPAAVQRRAIAAGAAEHSPVSVDTYDMTGPKPIRRMLQGAVVDPFGHLWLIGRILE